jgi:GNAT superfamily N-acetyltransferase
MEVRIIETGKRNYLDLLLLADEQESMIDKYLDRGEMFALYDGDLKSICVITKEDEGIYELKNIATYEKYQGKGYASSLIKYIVDYYKDRCKTMFVGTGDSPLTIPFYEHCGFMVSHRVENFFTDNYDHPIFENGIQLVDMIYLKRDF